MMKRWFRRKREQEAEEIPPEREEETPAGEEAPTGSTEPEEPFDVSPEEKGREEEAPSGKAGGFLLRLKKRLSKTRNSLLGGLERIVRGKKRIDDELMEELEEHLITSDLGFHTTLELIGRLEKKIGREELVDPAALRSVLQEEIVRMLQVDAPPMELSHHPAVILVVGVNGTGKTTTIGKLAQWYQAEGKRVMLVAGDTFRAAAIEQLEVWADRVGCALIKHQSGSDPSAVAFDALDAAVARDMDLVIIDTAGRLHTQKNLMEQLKKMKRVISGKIEGAPHETLLVLDATTGQNALSQAKLFHEALGVTGLILTKLDGTAKGGIVVAILQEMGLPLRFIGIGEGADDLRVFDAEQFAEALFQE